MFFEKSRGPLPASRADSEGDRPGMTFELMITVVVEMKRQGQLIKGSVKPKITSLILEGTSEFYHYWNSIGMELIWSKHANEDGLKMLWGL